MGSALDSGSSGEGLSSGRGNMAVFLGKIVYCHSALSTQVFGLVPTS